MGKNGDGNTRPPGGRGVPLEPIAFDLEAWWAELDRYREIPFMEEGRAQPPVPNDDEVSFD